MGATLAERYVRAKTGTLANVSCLSGFAGSPGHLPLVFSILVNDVGNPNDARRAHGPRRRDPGRLSRRRRGREVTGRPRRASRELGSSPVTRLPGPAPCWLGATLALAEQLRALLRCQLLPTSTPAPLVHCIHPINRTWTDVTQLHVALPVMLTLANSHSSEKISRGPADRASVQLSSGTPTGRGRRPRHPRPVSLVLSRSRPSQDSVCAPNVSGSFRRGALFVTSLRPRGASGSRANPCLESTCSLEITRKTQRPWPCWNRSSRTTRTPSRRESDRDGHAAERRGAAWQC